MTLPQVPKSPAITKAEDELARLGVQIDSTQSVLVRLLQDVVRAEAQLDRNQSAQLVEVNEKLLLSALASRADAESATKALRDAPPAAAIDALTNLPNRTRMVDRALQAMAQCRREGSRFALLFVDLDNFKHLNDSRGHAFGDEVLRQVAVRMLAAVREVDTVSRHGGDEFVVLLAGISQARDARTIAEKLIAAIAAPTQVDGQAVTVTASIGIAVYPDDGEDIDALIARADAAMYETKRRGRGGVAFHGKTPAGELGVAIPAVAPALPEVQAGEKTDLDQRHALLRDANERLVLAALTAEELRAAAERARLRQASFVAAVAEELRNPMAPIRIATAMLGRVPGDDPLLPHVRGIVERQMAHMSRLVGKLVAADAGADVLVAEPQQVDMANVIEAAITSHLQTFEKRAQRFESHLPPGAIPLLGDAVRLEQVVSNLLDNASKHTHDGGRISLSVVVASDKLTMTVTDNGIGISMQMLPHIFDTFVQDTHALGFNGAALGIGLTVARVLVHAHGGQLLAHSAGPGRGSQFVVMLPLATTCPPLAAVAVPAPGPDAER